MTSTAPRTVARPRRAALAALAGTSIEWYDFFIYATAAALVFRHVFFPPDMNPVLGTIVAFGTTSFGYLGRPIGAFLFGHLGDRFGRKPVLIATLLLMGVGTFGIGLLPSYEVVGPLAPLLLITLRLLQGVAMGGEWGGAALLAIEHAPAERRSFYGSFAQLGSSVGATLSSAVFAISEHIGDGLLAGSWRIPFLFSAVLVVIGLIIRSVVGESPEFVSARSAQELSAAPVREVFRTPKPLLIGIGAMLVATGGYYVTSSFFLAYSSEQAGVPTELVLNALIIAGLFEMAFVPLAGWLGDRWRPQYVVAVGLAGIMIVVVPLYLLAHTGSFLVITVMLAVTALFTGFNYGPIAAVLASIFPVRVRYTGTSLAYQGSALTAGALTPIVLPTLLGMSEGSPVLIFAYLALLCLVAIGCVLATRGLAARVERGTVA
ncbi:MFS transporter [Agromyces mediolanus]|uniref:MFS transporter n=1 Tax=Agromyces mediolanus TaxID=41986 RepID=A0A918CFV0_AGRME|nr:MFS transporter [Agromyces mediolanus]GGR21042.1 MFS transporter [Agromyces mediolanus]GLJ73748.1 MFS transporter [Agromyces mediolanus]